MYQIEGFRSESKLLEQVTAKTWNLAELEHFNHVLLTKALHGYLNNTEFINKLRSLSK